MRSVHPLDDPKAGDRYIFSHPRPDKSMFKRDFMLIADDAGTLYVVMDYLLFGKLEDFPFEAGLWKNGTFKKVRNGR